MCQEGPGIPQGLQTAPDVLGEAVHELENWGQKDNSSNHFPFSCWWSIRAKITSGLGDTFHVLLLLPLEMVLYRTFYPLEGGLFSFQRCCPAGYWETLKNNPLPFHVDFYLGTVIKQTGFGFIFPAQLSWGMRGIYQQEAHSGNGY